MFEILVFLSHIEISVPLYAFCFFKSCREVLEGNYSLI